uniref:Uncharacterized protein n=1 Tax=viral metagenome TaxID=1070528 RepID=A0A6M3JA06_9ZZZZ
MTLLEFQARVMACHCECLALNAANMYACITNSQPPYDNRYYQEAMLKWGIVDRDGNPILLETNNGY